MFQLRLPKGTRPTTLQGKGFRLRAQCLEDTEADYRTVMANREHLRNWCNDTWPEEDFTVVQNREDLAGHINDAEVGFAYGYTIWKDNKNDVVLGSVYLYPSAYFAERYDLTPDERLRLSAAEVLVDYWLSADLDCDTDFSRMFILTLQDWLLCDWGFMEIAWATRPAMKARRSLYKSLAFEWGRTAEAVNTKGWFQTIHVSSGIGSKV